MSVPKGSASTSATRSLPTTAIRIYCVSTTRRGAGDAHHLAPVVGVSSHGPATFDRELMGLLFHRRWPMNFVGSA